MNAALLPTPLALTPLAQASAEIIGFCLVEGLLVATFAGVLLRAVRSRNAGTRFAVWFSALVAIATLPLLGSAGWSTVSPASAEKFVRHASITLPQSWAFYIFWAWAAGAGLALARVGTGLWQLRALRRSCKAIDISGLDPVLRQTFDRQRGNRRISLCVSERVHAPVAIGFMAPAIVMPRELMRELSTAELQQVLLHELAHLRRRDDWTNLAQKVVKALLFFHPAVWWIERKVSLEREIACDDAVLAETASPRAYAQCLARLAEKNLLRRSAALAQAAVSRLRQTSLRVARILDSNRCSTSAVWRPAVPLVIIFSVVCTGLLLRAPRLVGFKDSGSRISSAPAPLQASTILPSPRPAATVSQLEQKGAERQTSGHAASREPMAQDHRILVGKATLSRPVDSEIAFLGEPMTPAPTPLRVVQVKAVENYFEARETFLVFIEHHESASNQDGVSGSITDQITVWHITVLQLTGNPGTTDNPKKVI